MTNTYINGSVVRCTCTFTVSGTPTDPSAVTFKQKAPDGTVTALVYGVDGALLKTSTGIYYTDVSVTSDGVWRYRFAGTGTAQSASEGEFLVTSDFQ